MRITLKQLTQKAKKAKPKSWYRPGKTVKARNGYTYKLTAPYGKVRQGDFRPQLTPEQMLRMGIFEGRYLNDDTGEFPREWFMGALKAKKLRPEQADVGVNFFKIKSRLPLSEWRKAGWVPGGSNKKTRKGEKAILSNPAKNPDTKAWFQWFCRYYIGRRIPELDKVQMKRWTAFKRHAGQIKANCRRRNLTCRPRQRQALLQWAYDPKL